MSERIYLITAPPRSLQRLETRLAGPLSEYGASLVPVGRRRALVSVKSAALAAEHNDVRSFPDLLRRWQVRTVEPVSDRRAVELLRARDPSEFNLERAFVDQGLERGGYDWHLAATGFPEAWAKLGGLDALDWQTVKIGQIDTGYTPAPALGWSQGRSSTILTDQDRNVFYEEIYQDNVLRFPWVNTDPASALDPLSGPNGGHGTRTASVLASRDESAAGRAQPRGADTTFYGFYGATPGVPYVPVRLSNSVIITDVTGDGLLDAMDHLRDKGCAVITMSMGAAYPFDLPRRTLDAIDRLYEDGIVFCCAAGNIIDPVVAPARNPRTLAVGGSTPADQPWAGSSFGAQVDICAPAWPIRRVSPNRRGQFDYGYGDGTSYATPLVAGAAALWLQVHGTELYRRYQGWRRVEAFRHVLASSARVPPHGWDKTQYGAGILDAASLLETALPPVSALTKDERPHPGVL